MRARVLSARRSSVWLSLVAAALLLGSSAPAVTIDWVPVGNPGNAADTPSTNCYAAGCGSVSYNYFISKNEVTNAQYAEFLNAVDTAGTNTLSLYNANMGSDANNGGITFVAGNPAGSKYVVKTTGGYGGTGFANKPVTYVSFFDTIRFTNWLNNGQGAASTETGAYTLLGGTPFPSNYATVARNALATTVLPSENEWYKAAFYSPGGAYFDYPAGTDTLITCSTPSATANRANCGGSSPVGKVVDVGSYPGSASPYGTFDQGGNAGEWNEQSIASGVYRGRRVGWNSSSGQLGAAYKSFDSSGPTAEANDYGFRVALVPEPGTGLLVMTGMLGLAAARRRA